MLMGRTVGESGRIMGEEIIHNVVVFVSCLACARRLPGIALNYSSESSSSPIKPQIQHYDIQEKRMCRSIC